MDVSQYLEIFIDETKEHLQTLSDQIMILEQEPENMDVINEIFRAAHSLKGMAGTMGFKRMQRLTHDMENVFQEVRSGNMTVQPELVDVLFRGLDALEAYLAEILETANEGTEDNEDIVNTLNSIAKKASGSEEAPKEEAKPAAASSGDDEPKYDSISITDFERSTFEKAKNDNQNIFGITVYLQETCILKAARAFLVFKALEELGEVIKAVPSVQDIEDEKFGLVSARLKLVIPRLWQLRLQKSRKSLLSRKASSQRQMQPWQSSLCLRRKIQRQQRRLLPRQQSLPSAGQSVLILKNWMF